MDCAEFLDRYTEFRDGLVTVPREARRFTRHIAQCPTCRRYDASVRRGILVLKASEPILPSPDFRQRLERRLERERILATPAAPARAGVLAAVFLAVGIMLLALEGLHRRNPAAPVLPRVPFPKPVAQAGVPFVSFQDPRASVVLSNPDPYGSALVEPVAAGR